MKSNSFWTFGEGAPFVSKIMGLAISGVSGERTEESITATGPMPIASGFEDTF